MRGKGRGARVAGIHPTNRQARRRAKGLEKATPAPAWHGLEGLEGRLLFSASGLDPAFGGDGTVVTGLPGTTGDTAADVVVQADGRVVVLGTARTGSDTADISLVRYNADGSLDSGFGTGGRVVTDLAGRDLASSVVVDDEGRIVVVGTLNSSQFTVTRYLSDGSLDTGFGTGGRVVTTAGSFGNAQDAAIDAQGRILVAGDAFESAGRWNFALMRYTEAGQLDTTFGGGDGIVTTDLDGGREDHATAIAFDGDQIVLTGRRDTDIAVARYDQNGTLDTTFGAGGWTTTRFLTSGGFTLGTFATDVAVDGSGRVTVAGYTESAGHGDWVLTRYLANGDLDATFGAGGRVITGVGTTDQAHALAIQGDGKILVGGWAYGSATLADFALARYTENGALDATFDGDGVVTTDFGGDERAVAMVLQTDGRIVVAGQTLTAVTNDHDLVLARYAGDPTNQAPVAADDAAVTFEDAPIVIDVLGNDTDGDGDVLSVISVSGASHGTVVINAGGTLTYTPGADFAGTDSFTYTVADGQGAESVSTATVSLTVRNRPDLAGVVYVDADNDGVFGAGEAGLGGVTLVLTGTATGLDGSDVNVSRTVTTDAGGAYLFEDLLPGTYTVTRQAVPAGYLDGGEAAGALGGSVDLTQDSTGITGIVVDADATGTVTVDAPGYDFGVIAASQIGGMAWADFNNDGDVNFGEAAIEGVSVRLTGTDDRGNAVDQTVVTDIDGLYNFVDLRPGDYTLTQTGVPAGYTDGRDAVGTVNGVLRGSGAVNDTFSGVVLDQTGSYAENYNFGERTEASGTLGDAQTAGIGFWKNKHGQALLRALDSDEWLLGDWLAATLPNLYGSLAGMSGADVADHYRDLFRRGTGWFAVSPAKAEVQVLATALAVYVTNESLAGTVAQSYGFATSATGVGNSFVNVGVHGVAFGVPLFSQVAVLDLLLAVNERSYEGVLYDMDGDGDAYSVDEFAFRWLASDVFAAINEAGNA